MKKGAGVYSLNRLFYEIRFMQLKKDEDSLAHELSYDVWHLPIFR